MANYAFLLTRGRGQTEWSTSVDNKENPKIQISNRNVCPGKINRERKKIIKKIITYRITTPPQNHRKTTQKYDSESPLLPKAPEKPTHNNKEKFQRKE
jgi:hypothetical protein